MALRLLKTIFFISLLSTSAVAKNGFIASQIIQAQMGQSCSQVTAEDIKQSGLDCRGHAQRLPGFAYSMLEDLVFGKAAENQIIKNKCLSEQIKQIEEDDKNRFSWFARLTSAWMKWKKAKKLLEICNWSGTSKTPNKHLVRIPICSDRKQMAALKESEILFHLAVPTVGNDEVFKMMEQARKFVINTKTGKPITDEEIYTSDITQADFIEVLTKDPELISTVKETLDKVAEPRLRVAEEMKKRLNPSYQSWAQKKFDTPFANSLTQDMKDYLFEEGSVYQVLNEQKLLGTPGGTCILSRYESHANANLSETFALSALGGLAFRAGSLMVQGLARIGAAASGASRGSRVISSGEALLMGYGLTSMPSEIWKSCLSETISYPRDLNAKQVLLNDRINENLDTLPGLVRLSKITNIKFDPEKTPSCAEAKAKDLIVNPVEAASCFSQSLNALPLKFAIPASLFIH